MARFRIYRCSDGLDELDDSRVSFKPRQPLPLADAIELRDLLLREFPLVGSLDATMDRIKDECDRQRGAGERKERRERIATAVLAGYRAGGGEWAEASADAAASWALADAHALIAALDKEQP